MTTPMIRDHFGHSVFKLQFLFLQPFQGKIVDRQVTTMRLLDLLLEAMVAIVKTLEFDAVL